MDYQLDANNQTYGNTSIPYTGIKFKERYGVNNSFHIDIHFMGINKYYAWYTNYRNR